MSVRKIRDENSQMTFLESRWQGGREFTNDPKIARKKIGRQTREIEERTNR